MMMLQKIMSMVMRSLLSTAIQSYIQNLRAKYNTGKTKRSEGIKIPSTFWFPIMKSQFTDMDSEGMVKHCMGPPQVTATKFNAA